MTVFLENKNIIMALLFVFWTENKKVKRIRIKDVWNMSHLFCSEALIYIIDFLTALAITCKYNAP